MAGGGTEANSTRAYAEAMAGAAVVAHRATPAAAFQRARALVRSGAKLDMAQLAHELGVGRATLYRWTGDRHRLLGDVVYAEVQGLLAHLQRTAPGDGVERLQRIADGFLGAIADNPGLQAFLTLEGDAGLRLVTAPAGTVRPRIIAIVTELIQTEVDAGRYAPPAAPRLLADGIVSVGERFLHHAGDRSMNPDPETATRIVALLLRE